MKFSNNQDGQALITLLFFTLIAMAVIAASVAVLYANTQATSTTEQGQMAYYLAESGAEDAMLQLLRDPSKRTNYTYSPIAGSTQVSVKIANSVITATGTYGSTARVVKVTTVYNSGALTIQSWQESTTP